MWLDRRSLHPSDNWSSSISEAIQASEALLYLVTADSVHEDSGCKGEWSHALAHHVPVIPLIFDTAAKVSHRLRDHQSIDFLDSFATGLANLRKHLIWFYTPEGQIHYLRQKLASKKRDHVTSPNLALQAEIEMLEEQIQRLGDGTSKLARSPVPSSKEEIEACFDAVPPYFEGRDGELKRVKEFVASPVALLLRVVGESGIGKNTLVGKALNALLAQPRSILDGVIYLNASQTGTLTLTNLVRQLQAYAAARKIPIVQPGIDPIDNEERLIQMLESFERHRVAVVVRNLELALDPQTLKCSKEFTDAVTIWLQQGRSKVKLMLITQVEPKHSGLIGVARQARLGLGPLDSSEGMRMFRGLDSDGSVGLLNQPDEVLKLASDLVGGLPRAIEMLYWCLVTERAISLPELLADFRNVLPAPILQQMVSKLFGRLDAGTTAAAQALAVFGRPVDSNAIEYLLKPFRATSSTLESLHLLVDMRLAQRSGRSTYFVRSLDKEYLLGTISPDHHPSDGVAGAPSFNQRYLFSRAADYFVELGQRADLERSGEVPLDVDVFRLRCAAQEFEQAAQTLFKIEGEQLMVRGFYGLLVELHTKLIGKLTEPRMQVWNLRKLGTALYRVGDPEGARIRYEEALPIAHACDDKEAEARITGNLGNICAEFGQIEDSLAFYESALLISRQLAARDVEAAHLISIGNRLGELGRVDEAASRMEEARDILSACHAESEDMALALSNLAVLHLDRMNYSGAINCAEKARSIAERAGSILLQSYSQWCVSIGYLFRGNLASAQDAIDEAARFDVPQMNHSVAVLRGIVAFKQGEQERAETSFRRAIEAATGLLKRNRRSLTAHETLGLAECGLMLCAFPGASERARSHYQNARILNAGAGLINREMAFLKCLTEGWPDPGLLAPVFRAIQGGSGGSARVAGVAS